MSDGDVLLDEIIKNSDDEFDARIEAVMRGVPSGAPPGPQPYDSKSKIDGESHTQWALGGNGRFSPVGQTVPTLPAGIYEPFAIPGMWGVERLKVSSDGIYSLPEMATGQVLDEAERFWRSEDKYRKHGLLYKRGIIMFGPPGSGKTITVKILMNELVQRDGIVVVIQGVNLAIMVLKAIRRIEPRRNLIVVFEDIDEIIIQNGESSVLSLLDGESSIDNVLMLATTNYADKLGARIINRPSRFDSRVYVDMPSDAARGSYLAQATANSLTESNLQQWVNDTKGMSIAHLRELVAAVYCLEQDYNDVVKRLKEMGTVIKAKEDGFRRGNIGLVGAAATANWA